MTNDAMTNDAIRIGNAIRTMTNDDERLTMRCDNKHDNSRTDISTYKAMNINESDNKQNDSNNTKEKH